MHIAGRQKAHPREILDSSEKKSSIRQTAVQQHKFILKKSMQKKIIYSTFISKNDPTFLSLDAFATLAICEYFHVSSDCQRL